MRTARQPPADLASSHYQCRASSEWIWLPPNEENGDLARLNDFYQQADQSGLFTLV